MVEFLYLNKKAALYANVKTETAITNVFRKFQSRITGFVGTITRVPF